MGQAGKNSKAPRGRVWLLKRAGAGPRRPRPLRRAAPCWAGAEAAVDAVDGGTRRGAERVPLPGLRGTGVRTPPGLRPPGQRKATPYPGQAHRCSPGPAQPLRAGGEASTCCRRLPAAPGRPAQRQQEQPQPGPGRPRRPHLAAASSGLAPTGSGEGGPRRGEGAVRPRRLAAPAGHRAGPAPGGSRPALPGASAAGTAAVCHRCRVSQPALGLSLVFRASAGLCALGKRNKI